MMTFGAPGVYTPDAYVPGTYALLYSAGEHMSTSIFRAICTRWVCTRRVCTRRVHGFILKKTMALFSPLCFFFERLCDGNQSRQRRRCMNEDVGLLPHQSPQKIRWQLNEDAGILPHQTPQKIGIICTN